MWLHVGIDNVFFSIDKEINFLLEKWRQWVLMKVCLEKNKNYCRCSFCGWLEKQTGVEGWRLLEGSSVELWLDDSSIIILVQIKLSICKRLEIFKTFKSLKKKLKIQTHSYVTKYVNWSPNITSVHWHFPLKIHTKIKRNNLQKWSKITSINFKIY